MATRKTAIAISEELLSEVDRAARARGESRSRYITNVLRLAVRARRDADVTRRLNEVFAEEATRIEHRHSAERLDEVGTDWTDERW